MDKYKHSRLALLLWTLLVFWIGYGNAAYQRPKVEVNVLYALPQPERDAACGAGRLQKQTAEHLNWSV